jgi:hypothetical protein
MYFPVPSLSCNFGLSDLLQISLILCTSPNVCSSPIHLLHRRATSHVYHLHFSLSSVEVHYTMFPFYLPMYVALPPQISGIRNRASCQNHAVTLCSILLLLCFCAHSLSRIRVLHSANLHCHVCLRTTPPSTLHPPPPESLFQRLTVH